jgi:HEAT repeat protein
LKDSNFVVRVAAASILGKCDWAASTVVPALVGAYREEVARLEEGDVRWHFLSAIGDVGPPARPAVPLLIQVIETRPSDLEVGTAIDALTAIRSIGKEGMAALEKAASTGEPEIRGRAQSALEEVSAEEER